MTALIFHQSYDTSDTETDSLFKMISYLAMIVLTFVLIFTNNWFSYCTMAPCIVSAYFLRHI